MEEKFFIVWNSNNKSVPTMRHSSFESAKAESERLALNNPKVKFYVLESVGFALTDKVDFYMSESHKIGE